MKQVRKLFLIHTCLQVDVPEECLPAASFTESRETTTWQKMIDTLQSWTQKASPYVCTFGSTVLGLGQVPCAQPGDHVGSVPRDLGGDHQEVS